MIKQGKVLMFIVLLIVISGCKNTTEESSTFNESPIWKGQELEVYVFTDNSLIFYNLNTRNVEKTEFCPRVRYSDTKNGGFYITCHYDPNQKGAYNDTIKFFDDNGNEIFKFGNYSIIYIRELDKNTYILRGENIEDGEFKSNTIVVFNDRGIVLVDYKTDDHTIDLDDVHFYDHNKLLYTESNSEKCFSLIRVGNHGYRSGDIKCLHKVEDGEITVSKGAYKKLNYLSIVNESNYIYSYLTKDDEFYMAEIDQYENQIWKIGPYKDIKGISKTTKGYVLSATDHLTYQTYILHIDNQGNELWRYQPVYLKKSAKQLEDGSFVFAHASDDYYVKGLNEDGELKWSTKVDGIVTGLYPEKSCVIVAIKKGTERSYLLLDDEGNLLGEKESLTK